MRDIVQKIRRRQIPYVPDDDPVTDALNEIEATINEVVDAAITDEELLQRCAGLIFNRLRELKAVEPTQAEQVDRLIFLGRRLLTEVFGVEYHDGVWIDSYGVWTPGEV